MVLAGWTWTVVPETASACCPGPCRGVTTSGLHWVLEHTRLDPGSTLGLANRVDVEGASVWVESGQLLVIEIANNEGGAS